jgi:hypothetical protein
MRKILLLLSLLCIPLAMKGQKTLLSGTLNNPDGTGFNGQLILSLAQQSAISSANGCGGPVFVPSTVQVIIKFVNGAMQNPPHIYGSDCTLPYGVPYNVIARDNQGNTDFTAQWLPMGVSQNIGNIQSVANPLGTLFGLTLSSLALTGAQNVFTQNNTFQQNVTINGTLSVSSIYPVTGTVSIYGQGGQPDLKVYNTAGTLVFEVYDNGLVQSTLGSLQAAGYVVANQGFLVNGSGGTSGQCLVSNGTAFIPGTCGSGGTAPTFYYYDWNGANLPQRGVNAFQPGRFTLTDNAVGNATFIDLATTGVTAGTYFSPSSVTVDSYGRVTSITGSGGGTTQIVKAVIVTSGICTTPNAANAQCGTAVRWTTPFPNGDVYVPTCTAGFPTNSQLMGTWIDPNSISPTGFTFYIANGSGNGAFPISVTAIYCIGVG